MHKKQIIESEALQCTFLPSDGGRLVSLIDKLSGRDYIWTNKRTENTLRYYGANYDDLGAGGVEEAFPTGLEDEAHCDKLPFFGELWSVPWRICKQTVDMLEMECYSSIYPMKLTKTYRLEVNTLSCSYTLANEGPVEIPYLLGIHPSIRVRGNDPLRLPTGKYHVGTAVNVPHVLNSTFSWPFLNGRDLSKICEGNSSGECLEFRSNSVSEGCIELINGSKAFFVEFDPAFFPALSCWLIYGGWRGHYCVMVEFFSGWPFKLSEAITNEKYAKIDAYDIQCTTVIYRVE